MRQGGERENENREVRENMRRGDRDTAKQRKKWEREEGDHNENQGLYDYSALQASTKMGAVHLEG